MIELYTGFDTRETVGSWVFANSVVQRCSVPVSVTQLSLPAIESVFGAEFRGGSTAFACSRFLIPALRDFRYGVCVFADGADMLCRCDLAEILELVDATKAVQVVPHEYRTRHPRKFVGTALEADNDDYPAPGRKNWASVMVMNCGHMGWRRLSPSKVARLSVLDLMQFKFLTDDEIGYLPLEWNWLVDEYGENEHAKILHWTAGMPGLEPYKDAPQAHEWHAAHESLNYRTD